MRIAVVGSGIGGLTAATLLAQDGHEVHVYEQHQQAGGVTAGLEKDGFRWDMGQLILEGFGPGDPVGLILDEMGLSREIELIPADRVYQFPDFRIGPEKKFRGDFWRRDFLKALFPEDSRGIDKYFDLYVRMMEIVTLGRKADTAPYWKRKFIMLRLYARLLPIFSLLKLDADALTRKFFSNPKLRAVFLSILADFVTPPSRFQGLGICLINPEPAFDHRVSGRVSKVGRQPKYHCIRGGTRNLVAALSRSIRSHGGTIETGKAIRKIACEGGRAGDLEFSDGKRIAADLIVVDVGAKEAFRSLIDAKHLTPSFLKIVDDIPLMESVFLVELGVDFDPVKIMGHPLVYYYRTYDIEPAIQRLQSGEFHEGRDGFVMYVPSAISPEMAPPGFHSVTLYTVAPDRLKTGTYAERKEELADKLIAEAERDVPGLKARTKTRIIMTPEDFRSRIAVSRHSFGGLAPIMGSSGIPHRTPISNLFYVGAMSESGAGMNNVIGGAWKAVRLIRRSITDGRLQKSG